MASKRRQVSAADARAGSTSSVGSGAESRGRLKSAAAATVMALLVVAVYLPAPSQPGDNTLFAIDYYHLHARRITFAQEALLEDGTLPAWYPRELMGTPFWSNIQNFPFIPTRLVLLALDTREAMAAGVILAAVLAAVFTFLFARQLGIGRIGSATAGWTFACSGFFAARIMAGHLPLLEAYPALPLLLWRIEACVSPTAATANGWRRAMRLGVLALATLCVVLAGHPQLPLYAVVVAGTYLVYRAWGRWRTMSHSATAMALGAGCAGFSLWPMFELIGRSTRVLRLDDAANDINFPYARLLAFVLPWRDGWPERELGASGHPFADAGYPNMAYFWETVCYVGWAPLVGAIVLLALWIARPKRRSADNARLQWWPNSPWGYFAVVGVLTLVTALPAVQQFVQALPGTILRSPARQVYITTFVLALAVGLAADVLFRQAVAGRQERRRLAAVALGAALLGHMIDLGTHSRAFVRMFQLPDRNVSFERRLRQFVGSGRAAIDYSLPVPFNRAVDDIGFFDSIMLARPYAALMDLAGAPATHNVQDLVGSDLPVRALASTATRVVMSERVQRPDLKLASDPATLPTYVVPNPLPRVQFFPASEVIAVDEAEMHRRLRDRTYDAGARVMLTPQPNSPWSPESSPTTAAATAPAASAADYSRPSSDEIIVRVHAASDGILRVLESWDPGWTASVGGDTVDVLCTDTTFLGVALPAGDYEVRFRYQTPGASTGIGMSLGSLLLLSALLLSVRKGTAGAVS